MIKQLFSIALLATLATPVSAMPIVYNTQAAFDAATTTTQTIDFEGETSATYTYRENSYTVSGVTFSSDVSSMFTLDANYYSPSVASDYLNLNDFGTHFIDITAGAGATAIGVDFGTLNTTFGTSLAITAAVTDSSGTNFYNLTAPTQPTLDFIGFTSNSLITSVKFTGELLVLDNVTIGSVPEPATLALMGLGLAGLGFSRKRKTA